MRILLLMVALVLAACVAHGQSFATSPRTLTEMIGAIGHSGQVLELPLPERAQNSAEVLGILLERRRTVGPERMIDPALANDLRRAVSQVLRHGEPVPPHLFQVESAFRFEEPGGQTLMLICKSCPQPVAMIASERGGSVALSPYFRIDPLGQLLERASPQFRDAPSQRPVMRIHPVRAAV